MKKYSSNNFIEKAIKVHGNKYNYSKVNYIFAIVKVIIICPEHGEFTQTPNAHLNGQGCPKCGIINNTLTQGQFLQKAIKVHGDKYDYSKSLYTKSENKIIIICPIHREFEQIADIHLRGSICPLCNIDKMKLTKEEFIQKAITKHGNKYHYNKVVYNNSWIKVVIICPEHGEFEQVPSNHLNGNGCPKCFGLYRTTEEFIQKAIKVHGNKYDYSKVDYINAHTKIIITCKKHGDFSQSPNSHLSNKQGCPICKASKGELAIKVILDKHNIKNQSEYRIPEVADELYYDFYLPDYNLLIEFHGKQHYEYIPFLHKHNEDNFLRQKNRDDAIRHNTRKWKYRYLEFNYKQLKELTKEQFEELIINSINKLLK